MELYAEREGCVQCAYTTFNAAGGIKINIRVDDGEATVEINGVSAPLTVCDGLPLTIKVYELPNPYVHAPN